MQYKLIQGSSNNIHHIIPTVLINRGITNPDTYLHLTEECVCDWKNLNNIKEAVECFVEHFERRDEIAILVDSDP